MLCDVLNLLTCGYSQDFCYEIDLRLDANIEPWDAETSAQTKLKKTDNTKQENMHQQNDITVKQQIERQIKPQ